VGDCPDLRFGELHVEPGGDLPGGGVIGQRNAAPRGALHAEVPGGRLALAGGDSLQQLVVHLVHLLRLNYDGTTHKHSIGWRQTQHSCTIGWTPTNRNQIRTDQPLSNDSYGEWMPPINGIRF